MKVFSKQTGETIVEVMLSVVLLGFTMTTIYVIARRSLDTGQAASERSQVLAMVETQLERLKVLAELSDEERLATPSQDIFASATAFCIDAQLMKQDPSNVGCYDSTFPSNAGLRIEIRYDADGPDDGTTTFDDDTFNISSNWARVNSEGATEQLDTAYRIHRSIPPAQPQVSCGESPLLNITEHLRSINAGVVSFDAFYIPPQYQADGSLDIFVDPATGDPVERAESDPDFPLDPSLGVFIHETCEYAVSYTMWCTAPFGGTYTQNTNCGNDQPNEVLRIRFWDSMIGDSCTGDVLAYIDTDDSPFTLGQPGVANWGGNELVSATSSNRILGNGLARCMDVIHICELPQLDFLALNGLYKCEENYYRNVVTNAYMQFPTNAVPYEDANGDGIGDWRYFWQGVQVGKSPRSSVHLHDVDWTVITN